MSFTRRPALTIILLLAACGGSERPSAGDAITPEPATTRRPLRDSVQLTVTADVDGARSTYRGLGECHHTPAASIYDVPASMWSAGAEAGGLRYVNPTLWQPRGAGEMQVSLGLTAGGHTHQIATVKGADPRGTGNGRVEPSGAGGSLHVEGKDADGRDVRLTVECTRWTEPVAEGG